MSVSSNISFAATRDKRAIAYPEARLLGRQTLSKFRVTGDGMMKVDPHARSMSVATAWTDLDGFRDRLVEVLAPPLYPR